VMKRAASLLGDRKSQLRAYYVPLAWAEANAKPKAAADGGADANNDEAKLSNAEIMRRNGFVGIQGVGGLVSFPAGEFDSFYALAIYAPPPYEKAMHLLNFPGAAAKSVTWVPKDVGSQVTLSWDLKDFWKYYGPLYDDLSGEGIEGA